MKQWRTILVVMGLIILFLIANFSVQITTRRRKNSSKVGDPKKASSVSEKNGTFRGKLKKKSNSSSIEDAVIIPDSKCWEEEDTQILAECIHCSDYEKRTLLGCQESGNIQLTLCIVSNIKLYKSCPHVIEWEEKKFWMFEGLMLIGLMVSSSVVWYRQRQLDSIFYEKLQKQVESDTV